MYSAQWLSMAFLSLCIKLFRYLLSCSRRACFVPGPPLPPHFHPHGFSSLTISTSPVSSRLQPLHRLVVAGSVSPSLASVSARMYRKIYTIRVQGGETGWRQGHQPEDETEEWAMWRRPGRFSRRVSPVTFHYRLITSEYSFRVSPCLLAYP